MPVAGIPRVKPGDKLAELLSNALSGQEYTINEGDVLVVAQKIVSKAESAVLKLSEVTVSPKALELAREVNKDPRLVQVILDNSVRIVRSIPGVLITETPHGFICANAGVDASNSLGPDTVVLLPEDPDESAKRLRDGIAEKTRLALNIVISDTFNRPWREGSINVAIGTAGFVPLHDARGALDDQGRTLRATLVSVADELASAAQLVMGEAAGVPAAVISGVALEKSDSGSASLLRARERDLFR